jgi:hypothetical protein
MVARLSSWLSGVDEAGARDNFWGCHHIALLHLAAKLFHVGADVDGLTHRLHRPTDWG